MAEAEGEAMSKSAKRRAAEKRRAAAVAEEAAPVPTPAPAAKSKAAAKSAPAAAAASPKAATKSAPAAAKAAAAPAEAAPKGKAKAKAEAKADPKASAKAAAKSQPAPASAKASAKSQAAPAPAPEPATGKKKKGGAAAEVAPAPAPVQAAAKAQPAGKSAAKSKAKAEPDWDRRKVQPPEPEDPFARFDDGTGGDWDTAVGVSKKDKKRKEKKDEEKENEQPTEKRPLYKTEAPAGGNTKGKGKGDSTQQSAPRKVNESAMEALTRAVQAEAAAKVAAYQITNAPKEGDKAVADVPTKPLFQRTLEVPGDKIGRVIGPKGANIAKIQEHFEGKINRIDTSGGFCVISGEEEEAVVLAETAIKELISRGYMSISFKDLKEDTVTVKSMYLPEIIGKGGAIIKKIKEVTKVEIDIPQEGGKGKGAEPIEKGGKGAGGKGGKGDDNKPVKIQLAGEAEGVAKAKEIIESICKNYCHPAVHEDMVHKEMEVDHDNHRYIIGRGGSEMRHMQKNWNVKINLPKWDWEGNLLTENANVVIVGSEHDVPKVQAYIEKTIANALDESKQRDENPGAPKGGDKFDKDEEPEEAWMKGYMYKR